ncbi:DNA-binding Lrp family transcriptional regulator [Labrenzia sp. MBR-25]
MPDLFGEPNGQVDGSGDTLTHFKHQLPEHPMVPFFVMIKCQLGKTYQVADAIADAEIASEVYSTSGDYDLLVKFYVEDGSDIGHFVNEKVHPIDGIQDTKTIITFKAF